MRRYLISAIPKGKQLDYMAAIRPRIIYVSWLFKLEDKIRQKHARNYEACRMAKAITYILNREPYLAVYLEDERCSFSNNLSENAICLFVVGRKGGCTVKPRQE